MATESPLTIWGPPVLEGFVTVLAVFLAYWLTKWYENRKKQEERFRHVYAPIMEELLLYVRFHSLWRDTAPNYDPELARERLLAHIRTHLGDFGPSVVSAYLGYAKGTVQYSGRGGEPNYVGILWRVIDEAYGLIVGNNLYDRAFREDLNKDRQSFFIWALMGDHVVRHLWNVHTTTLSERAFSSLKRRYGKIAVRGHSEDLPEKTVIEAVARQLGATKRDAEKLILHAEGKHEEAFQLGQK